MKCAVADGSWRGTGVFGWILGTVGRADGGGGGEIGVVVQDPSMQILQFGTRIEAELVGQSGTAGLVFGERVDGAATPVQGEHEVAHRSLTEGMFADHRGQLGDQLSVATQCE